MFSHVMVGVSDLEASRKFYDALLGTLGIGPGVANKARYFYRSPTGTFGITIPINGEPATHANGGTIGFTMSSPEQADAFHAAGVAPRRHHLRRPAGLARGLRGQALPGLPARPRRQQTLRAVPTPRPVRLLRARWSVLAAAAQWPPCTRSLD
jgi:catechol 2,3-dioxygenase-like lactoylglutathione lyase family enzyme